MTLHHNVGFAAKNTRTDADGDKPLKCKCGSIRIKATLHTGDDPDDGHGAQISVYCAACDRLLFYNGA